MSTSVRRIVRFLITLSSLGAAACGGPTTPSVPPSDSSGSPDGSPSAGSIVFLSSDPAPGSEVIARYIGTSFAGMQLRTSFSIRPGIDLADARFQLDVFDEAGERCGYGFTPLEPRSVLATETVIVEFSYISWSCKIPGRTVSATVTVLSFRVNPQDPGGQYLRTDHLVRTFPLTYSYRAYPPAPPGVPLAAPTIASFSYVTNVPACGGCGPLPGESVSVPCRVTEPDGAAVTITITLTWEGQPPQIKTETFPEGASSSQPGAILVAGGTAPQPPPGSPYPRATTTCVARNSRGETAQQTIQIPR